MYICIYIRHIYLHYYVILFTLSGFSQVFPNIYRVVENLEICLLKLFRIEELLAPRYEISFLF